MSLPPLSAPGYRDSREEDRRLLNQYVRQQSQSAFAALLKRHLNFVYSVCLREVRQPELAQDAAQIVFLALAQQAPRLRNNTVLKSWLFQVARYAARDMRRKEVRRALREQRACEEPCRSWPPSRPSADANPESEIEPLLNEALAALNPGERSLILLRFFEERSFKEVGNAHHISEDAARMRVTRALARMRRFFQTAGIVLSVEALTALLPRHAAQAAPFSPEALFPELQSADPSRLSGTLTEPSRRIATKGVLRAMNRTTWKMVALAGLGMALLFGGVAWRERHAVPASAPTKAQSDLAAKLASDNKAAITAIQTYYAEVKLVYEPAKVQRTARYWRGRAIVRITEQEQADRVVDIECKDDRKTIITTLPKPPLPNEGRVQITDKNRRATECDAWEWSLFQLPVGLYSTPPKSLYTLSEALQKGRVTLAEWTTENGKKQGHIKIELPDEARGYEIWTDPMHNGLVNRCIHQIHDKNGAELFRFEYRVEEWTQASPTLFVPTRVAQTSWYKGKHTQEETVTLTAVRVNADLPKRPPMPTLPAGTWVMNEVEHVFYRIDADGKRMGPVNPVTDVSVAADGRLDPLP